MNPGQFRNLDSILNDPEALGSYGSGYIGPVHLKRTELARRGDELNSLYVVDAAGAGIGLAIRAGDRQIQVADAFNLCFTGHFAIPD